MAAGRGARERGSRTRWQRFKDALQSNQNFEYLYWVQVILGFCFDWTLRLIGPILLVFATGLISTVIALYFMFILPRVATFGSITYTLHAMWAVFLAFNVFFNYYHCAFTHPGKPGDFLPASCKSDEEDEDVTEDEEAGVRHLMADAAGMSRVNGSGESTRSLNRGIVSSSGGPSSSTTRGGGFGGSMVQAGFCKKCKGAKPVRAHHCHVCNQCIVNMDHHCPWMNNCVGYLNYRYFVLFLMYMFVGCMYGVLVTAPQVLSLTKNARHFRKGTQEANTQSAVMMTFVLSFSVGIAIMVLLGWHIYLILTAQTTIDFYQNQSNRARARQFGEIWTNPFDVGCKRNWQQVFGAGPFLVALLPSRRPPPPPVVEFFPMEPPAVRRLLEDEGEWTVDSTTSAGHVV